MFCTRCGSGNHTNYDCSKPDQKLSPPQKAVAAEVAVSGGVSLKAQQPSAEPMFEPTPRFKGCPPICTHANLPSFPDEASLLKWQGQFEGHHIKTKWLCEACAHWHFTSVVRGPSGASSGGERDSQIPASWKPPKQLPPSRLPQELPRHEAQPEPEKKPENKPLQKPRTAQSKSRESELFG
jgi:hypothetical protein